VARKAAVLSALIIAPFGILVALLGLLARTGRYFDPEPYLQDPQMMKMVLPTLMTTPPRHRHFLQLPRKMLRRGQGLVQEVQPLRSEDQPAVLQPFAAPVPVESLGKMLIVARKNPMRRG